MKRLILLLLAVAVVPAFAIFHNAWHDAGLFTIKLSNHGRFGYENCGIWPRGTNEFYIFGAGIWVGALKTDTLGCTLTAAVDSSATALPVTSTAGFDTVRGFLRLDDEVVYYRGLTPTGFDSCVRGFGGTDAAGHASGAAVDGMLANVSIGYDPSTGGTEIAPGDLPNEPGYTDSTDRILFTDVPDDTALWPVRHPGGAMLVVSNEDSYNVSNDLDTSRHYGGGGPLDIKTLQTGYAWYYHYYEDFIFLTYQLVNNSTTDTLEDLFVGLCCDADVGDATDDLVGSDASRDLGYTWDSDFHEAGWGRVPGYVGYDFLESPPGPGGQQLGLTAFKILKNPGSPEPGVPDPENDLEALLTIAGYDHPTGDYHPVDSIEQPTDVRFLQCTGPFDLGPQDTGRVVIAVIYGADTADLQGNSDLAQRLYDSGFITHRAWVDSPNGGEEIAGSFEITWRDSSATGAPLLADVGCSRDRGRTWTDIAVNIPSTGSYQWNTADYPDGTRYLVRVTVHDTIAVGEDLSDSVFTVNNPGNGTPDIELLAPLTGTLRGSALVSWDADDPDHDSLTISLFIGPDTVNWETVATGLPNTGNWDWNTVPHHNGWYYIRVRADDADTFSCSTSDAMVELANDHPVVGDVEHVQGGCNSLSIQALEYDSTRFTGHQYEISFEPIIRGTPSDEPLYRYNLRDVTGDTGLLAEQGLQARTNGELFTFFSPFIDGFALQFDAQLDRESFRFTDCYEVRNASGFDGTLEIQGADSLGTAPPLSGYEWCFRGSDYLVGWVRDAQNDSLTLDVYDVTNSVAIPYDRNRGDCWHLGTGSNAGRYYDQVRHQVFYLGGGFFWFDRLRQMTVPPGPGDTWAVRSAGHRVPCQGNRYRFSTPTGIAEASGRLLTGIHRVAPNPVARRAFISYSLGAKQHTDIAVYNTVGRRVRTLASGILPPGHHTLSWDGTDDAGRRLSTGVYFCRLETDTDRSIRKLVLVE